MSRFNSRIAHDFLNEHSNCPSCRNPAYNEEALFCPRCGESLRRSAGCMNFIKSPQGKLSAFIVIFLSIIGFTHLMTPKNQTSAFFNMRKV